MKLILNKQFKAISVGRKFNIQRFRENEIMSFIPFTQPNSFFYAMLIFTVVIFFKREVHFIYNL